MYAPYNTFIGTGVVAAACRATRRWASRRRRSSAALLDGSAPSGSSCPERVPTQVELDWRQVRRWGIDEADIPPYAVLRFKEPTFWEAYKNVAIAGESRSWSSRPR